MPGQGGDSAGEAGPRPSAAGRRASVPWALAGLGLLVVWLFRETLFFHRVFYKRDILLVWYPQVEVFVRAVASGSWPLWNPSLAFGQPLMADPHAQILYPLTWLNLVLRPWQYYTLYALLHALVAAFGTVALARHWGLSLGASWLAAAVWVFSGPYISSVDLWHHLASISWMPLVVLAADRALERRTWRDTLLWALAQVVQALAGSVEMCTFTALLVGGLAFSKHLRFDRGSSTKNAPIVKVGVLAALVTVGLTGILWVPAVDLASRSGRWALASDVRTYWSTHPLVLLETLLPGLFSALPLSRDMRALLFESREPYLASLFLGVPALGLVGAAFAGRSHPLRRLLAVLAVLGLFVALGRHTGAYGLVTLLLPPLRIVRYPVKIMLLTAFCWSLLAGIGFDAWRRRAEPVRGWTLRVVGPLALLAVVDLAVALGLILAPQAAAARVLDQPAGALAQAALRSTAARLLVGASLSGLAAVLAVTRARRPALASPLAAVLGFLAVAELVVYHRHPNPAGPKALVTHRPEVLSAIVDPDPRVYVYDYSAPDQTRQPSAPKPGYVLARQPLGWDRDEAFALAMQMYLAPETAGRWGLRSSYQIDYRGLASPVLDRMSHLLRYVEGDAEFVRLLELGNVTHVVSLHEAGYEALQPVASLPGLFEAPVRVFRVKAPLPRTYAVGKARLADGLQAIPAVLAADFDPRREVVLPLRPQPDASEAFRGTSEVRVARADQLILDAELSEPGYVVLAEGFDPGWRAAVDGRPASVLRANGIFRAVPVSAGRHVVEMTYRPRPVLVGLTLSLATVLVLGTVVLRRRRARPAIRP